MIRRLLAAGAAAALAALCLNAAAAEPGTRAPSRVPSTQAAQGTPSTPAAPAAPAIPPLVDGPEIDPQRTQTLERMKSWKPWYGQWEGTLHVLDAGSRAKELPLRLSMSQDLVVLETRVDGGKWEEIDCAYQAMAPTPVSATVTFHRAGGRWVETMQFAMTRVTGDVAQVWLMRTVNNWNGKPPAGVDPLFAVMRSGMFKRIGPPKAKSAQPEAQPT